MSDFLFTYGLYVLFLVISLFLARSGATAQDRTDGRWQVALLLLFLPFYLYFFVWWKKS